MIEAKVIGIRRTLVVMGMEQVTSGRKSVDHVRQTWLCSHERIAPIEWSAMPVRLLPATGFDPADDDIAF